VRQQVVESLWQLSRGQTAVVKGFTQSLTEAYRVRLVELGFRPGAAIACTMAPKLGAPKLYRVDNAVYSLEQKIAECIQTESVTV
jgi:Fe2+ transport system protein FeoA